MRFTVVWNSRVEDELADLWLNARDRDEIQEAADFFDQHLQHEADVRGSPYGRERVLTRGPLAAAFAVSLDDRIARITQVWLIATN